jgi:hypothetical protein
MHSPRPPAAGRLVRWVLLTGLLIGATFVALLFFGDPLPHFEARVAALQRAGQPILLSDLPASSPIPHEVRAQVTALKQAIAQLDSRLNPTTSRPDWDHVPASNDALFHETVDLRREIRNRLRTEPVLKALLQPDPDHPVTDEFGRQLDQISVLHGIERWLLATSRQRALSKDPVEAVELFTDAVKLRTTPIPRDGSFLWVIDGADYNRTLIQLLESGSLDDPQLSRIRQALETLEGAPLLRDSQLLDRALFIQMIRKIAHEGNVPLAPIKGFRNRSIAAVLSLRLRLFVGLGFLDEAACIGLDEFNAQLASLDRIGNASNPPDGRWREDRIKSASRWVRELYLGPTRPEYNGAIAPKTHARMGLLAIAAHRYRLDHGGRFPSTPADLIPKYLEVLPVDPASGGPPIFQALNPGVGIGFDRSSLTGTKAVTPTDPGGPSTLLQLTR